jgi:dipeptidase D
MGGLPLPTEISDFVEQYTPAAKGVWDHFNEIRQIPRASREEGGMREYILGVAKEHKFEHAIDAAGNILVYVPANNGSENSVCLQAHMDMVAAADDATFDFKKTPLQLALQDGWVSAKGTSLGADDGMGVASALAVATDPNVKHSGLELLFTVEEEIGCNGAHKLGIDLKSKYLINLDSEDGDVIYNGCAGSITLTSHLTAPREEVFHHRYVLKVSGLEGGHSGVDIHEEQRGNAFWIAGKVLENIERMYGNDFRIIDVNGEQLQARNKIPNYA